MTPARTEARWSGAVATIVVCPCAVSSATVSRLSGSTVEMAQAVADAVPDDVLAIAYPDAVGGILDQYASALGWFGAVARVGAVLIWRGNRTAIWVTAMAGGLADVG